MERIAVLLSLALSSTGLLAQRTPKPGKDIAARARVLIEQEGNLKEAVQLLEANLERGTEHDQRRARLWLGHALARMGKPKEARAQWAIVAKGDDEVARAASDALSQKSDRVERHVITLINRLATDQAYSQVQSELLWLGDAARPRLLARTTIKRLETGETSLEHAQRIFEVLMHMGGDAVVERIERLAKSNDVLIRRALVYAWSQSQLGRARAIECQRAMRAFLRDPVESLRKSSFSYCAQTLSLGDILEVAEKDPVLRSMAFLFAISRWRPSNDANDEDQNRLLDLAEAGIERATAQPADESWVEPLIRHGSRLAYHPRGARALLRLLAGIEPEKAKSWTNVSVYSTAKGRIPAQEVAALYRVINTRDPRWGALGHIKNIARYTWTSDDLEGVLELASKKHVERSIVSNVINSSRDDQLSMLIAELASMRNTPFTNVLVARVTKSAEKIEGRLIEELLSDKKGDALVSTWLQCLNFTTSTEADDARIEVVKRYPNFWRLVARHYYDRNERQKGKDFPHAVVRQLLVLPNGNPKHIAKQDMDATQWLRSNLLKLLVDSEARDIASVVRQCYKHTISAGAGLTALIKRNGPLRHSRSPEEVAEIFKHCLATSSTRIWGDVAEILSSKRQCPTVVCHAIAEQFDKCPKAPDERVVWGLARRASSNELRAFVTRQFESKDPRLIQQAFNGASPHRAYVPALTRLLEDKDFVARSMLMIANLNDERDTPLMIQSLSHSSENARYHALSELIDRKAMTPELLAPLLRDSDINVQRVALKRRDVAARSTAHRAPPRNAQASQLQRSQGSKSSHRGDSLPRGDQARAQVLAQDRRQNRGRAAHRTDRPRAAQEDPPRGDQITRHARRTQVAADPDRAHEERGRRHRQGRGRERRPHQREEGLSQHEATRADPERCDQAALWSRALSSVENAARPSSRPVRRPKRQAMTAASAASSSTACPAALHEPSIRNTSALVDDDRDPYRPGPPVAPSATRVARGRPRKWPKPCPGRRCRRDSLWLARRGQLGRLELHRSRAAPRQAVDPREPVHARRNTCLRDNIGDCKRPLRDVLDRQLSRLRELESWPDSLFDRFAVLDFVDMLELSLDTRLDAHLRRPSAQRSQQARPRNTQRPQPLRGRRANTSKRCDPSELDPPRQPQGKGRHGM